jgi:hypothetical protein
MIPTRFPLSGTLSKIMLGYQNLHCFMMLLLTLELEHL